VLNAAANITISKIKSPEWPAQGARTQDRPARSGYLWANLSPADQRRLFRPHKAFFRIVMRPAAPQQDFSHQEPLSSHWISPGEIQSPAREHPGSRPELLTWITKFAALQIDLPQYDLALGKRSDAGKAAEFAVM
jgi:hypothetical protein